MDEITAGEKTRIFFVGCKEGAPHSERLHEALSSWTGCEMIGHRKTYSVDAYLGKKAAIYELVRRSDVVVFEYDPTDIPLLLRALKRCKSTNPKAMALVTFVPEEIPFIRAALAAGASGLISRKDEESESFESLRALIEKLTTDEVALSAGMSRLLLGELVKEFKATQKAAKAASIEKEYTEGLPQLTARQLEVVLYMCKGYNARQAGEALGIGRHTVASHLRKVYRELDVNSRPKLAREAARLGLLRT